MDGKDKKPEIRFSGFTDAWEQRKVGDVLTEKQRPIKMEDDVEYQLITVKRRNEGIVSRGYFEGRNILVKNYFEIRSGDYLISKRQVVHGANGVVPEGLDKSIVSNEYLVSIGNKKITTEYWALISKRPDMYRLFFLSSYGVDIEKLVFDVEDWKKRIIIIPSLPEQGKITMIFQYLDNLITLHQRKYDKLVTVKKSMLIKMFPKDRANVPEIRFVGFTDAWEQRKLGEILTAYSFKPYVAEPQANGEYEVIQQGDNPVVGYSDGKPFLDYESVVLFGDHTLSLYKPQTPFFVATDGIKIIGSTNKANGFYLLYLLERYKPQSEGYKRYYSILKDCQCFISTNLQEQRKIGNYFNHLDHLIALHQRKLEKLKNIKKSMLEKMFV